MRDKEPQVVKFDVKRATKPNFVAQSRLELTLYFSQQLSSTCNKGSMNIFVVRQVGHASSVAKTRVRVRPRVRVRVRVRVRGEGRGARGEG